MGMRSVKFCSNVHVVPDNDNDDDNDGNDNDNDDNDGNDGNDDDDDKSTPTCIRTILWYKD